MAAMQQTNLNRLRVGIFFGGSSREREVSFAGGRTVYDNLDKDLFTAIPIFVDEFGNMCVLNWEYIYRGTIRDFYPPVSHLPASPNAFQIYSESIECTPEARKQMLSEVGEYISPDQLAERIDLAFLALHGEHGEDGNIQGLLEWYKIPYTGSGILASAIGMNKAVQKRFMADAGFDGPKFCTIGSRDWHETPDDIYERVLHEVGYPMVVKAANQGSSIGVTILHEPNRATFDAAMETSLFRLSLGKSEWTSADKVEYVRQLSDIRSSLGFPLRVEDQVVYHPEEALTLFDDLFNSKETLTLEAVRGEVEIVVESFIPGREFSCIVVRDDAQHVIALPPTEIVKKSELFDYKSKYLPGLSRKVTPIDLPDEDIERIRKACSALFSQFEFNVYARIDGFYTETGTIFLNDPNTTSGMMPSSFFFHQAAEIGLNPSQFLTFLIRRSLAERIEKVPLFTFHRSLLQQLDQALERRGEMSQAEQRIAIIMGGYSTERHISVESGRNIYEKLASSGKYVPTPIFLTGDANAHRLFKIPINVMLKDNADDIKQKVEAFHRHDIMNRIGEEAASITNKYVHTEVFYTPQQLTYEDIKKDFDSVFIALHGRPGEDGAVQRHLDAMNMPYNGSGVASSSTTIDKFKTNNMLRNAGFLVADGALIEKAAYRADASQAIAQVLRMDFPLIAKPSDEGCSSAVKVIHNEAELRAYAELTFRSEEALDATHSAVLGVEPKEEFPQKDYFLVEQFIDRKGAKHFLEITGGMVTHMQDGQVEYEVFEPSEALAEGEILSLAEKFLAGEGQNITPARFDADANENGRISKEVRRVLQEVARFLNVEGYCRIDAFVRIFEDGQVEVIIIEINSLPGMTPATCIYHQAAINGYKPFEFIDEILKFGQARLQTN